MEREDQEIRVLRKRLWLLITALLALSLSAAGVVFAHPMADDGAIDSGEDVHGDLHHQHGATDGHLPASSKNVKLVGKMNVNQTEVDGIADVGVFGNYAYLAAFDGQDCQKGGVYVFDIANPAAPKQINFIRTGNNSYVGEGVQVIHIDTPAYNGDVLIHNNEICGTAGPGTVGGASLVDVTNPKTEQFLSQGFGDFDPTGDNGAGIAHQVHSAFAWDVGNKAYAVLVDDEEAPDVDIFDITNPRNPQKIREYDLAKEFPQILQNAPSNLSEVFFHDVIVKEIGGRQVMLLSYWDAGYVKLDVTDPANATYIGDTDFTNPDPELLESTGASEKPEGNGHEAEFTLDNRYVIGADEDFNPNGTEGTTDDNTTTPFPVVQGSDTPQLQGGESLTGTTVFVGRACPGDAAVPAAPATAGNQIAVVTRGVCDFTDKVANVEAAGGYEGIVVVNREGDDGCGLFGMTVAGSTPSFSVDRKTGFGFFGKEALYDEAACRAGDPDSLEGSLIPGDEPGTTLELGTTGDIVTIRAFFDGWGYVHLFQNSSGKMSELDTYAIPEAHDPAHASGSGDLSVHEAATSHVRRDLVYFSYYAGGFRVVKIQGGKLTEVGHFIDQGGNNFWGVQVFQRNGKEYVAASDMDYGLYIFEYTGRQ
jgi:hypothetical protein